MKKVDQTFKDKICKKYELQIRGTHGEHSDAIDGIYDLSNSRRLGGTREILLSDLIEGAV